MQGTWNSVAGWVTPPTTPAFLTPGTPLMHEGRPGEGPAVAPRGQKSKLGRVDVSITQAVDYETFPGQE